MCWTLAELGDFQLEFVIISWVINHMTCYKFECSHWLKLQNPDWKANLVKVFFNELSTNESTQITTGHVTYNPAYKYLKIPTENHYKKSAFINIDI